MLWNKCSSSGVVETAVGEIYATGPQIQTVQLLMVSSVLEDAVTTNENNTADFTESHIRDDLTSSLLVYVWPLIA